MEAAKKNLRRLGQVWDMSTARVANMADPSATVSI